MRILFLAFPILLFHQVWTQNCGISSILLSPVSEDTTPGTRLEKIRVVNMQSIQQNCSCAPNVQHIGFVNIAIVRNFSNDENINTRKSKNLLIITLDPATNLTTLIDEYKFHECTFTVTFSCTDNRQKTVSFRIPLIDRNSQEPRFDWDGYFFEVQLPWNPNIALNFDSPIYVSDMDRDLENVIVKFNVSNPCLRVLDGVISLTNLVNLSGRNRRIPKNKCGSTNSISWLPKDNIEHFELEVYLYFNVGIGSTITDTDNQFELNGEFNIQAELTVSNTNNASLSSKVTIYISFLAPVLELGIVQDINHEIISDYHCSKGLTTKSTTPDIKYKYLTLLSVEDSDEFSKRSRSRSYDEEFQRNDTTCNKDEAWAITMPSIC